MALTDKYKNGLKHRLRAIVHADDTPHRIALGVALGLFVAYLPPGLYHMALVIALAFLLKANKLAALTFVWVSNPFTYMPICYINCLLGRIVLGRTAGNDAAGSQETLAMMRDTLSLSRIAGELFTVQFWQKLGDAFSQVGLEILIGGLIIGTILGTISYFLSYRLIVQYRLKHHRLSCSAS